MTSLRERAGTLSDLRRIRSLLQWDQQVVMPPDGALSRSDHLATVAKLEHELLVAPALGRLLARAATAEDPLERDLARALGAERRRAMLVPAGLAAEIARAAAEGRTAWVRAREENDFRVFIPALRRNVELARELAARFSDFDHPYDALLDRYCEGVSVAGLSPLLERLRQGLTDLLTAVRDSDALADEGLLTTPLPEDRRRVFVSDTLAAIAGPATWWRLDDTEFAFAAPVAPGDVRLTTMYSGPGLRPLLTALHELGHGLYEHAFEPGTHRTTLDQGASTAVHESQSRLWENFVGRSEPFWRWCFPRLHQAFPSRYRGVEWSDLYRAANCVKVSPVRIHADELTYNLHIVVRVELEVALLDGRLDPADVGEAWRSAYRELLGVEIDNERDGALQDIHWAAGMFGYFPSYALGNVLAAQLWDRMAMALPDRDAAIAEGEFGALRDWLAATVQCFGRRIPVEALIRDAVGQDLDPAPLLSYLRSKLTSIHGVDARELRVGSR